MFVGIRYFVFAALLLVFSVPFAQAQSVEKQFEDALNGMLIKVHKDMQAYKKERQVLESLLKPVNLRDPDFIAENKILFDATAKSMRGRMDDIIQVFEKTDQQISSILALQPPKAQTALNGKWERVQKQNTLPYVTFFIAEEEILKAQESLMQLYYDHRESLDVDVPNEKIFVPNPAAQNQQLEYLTLIQDLKAQQKAAL